MKKNDTAASPDCLTTARLTGMTCLKTFTVLIMLILISGFSRTAAGPVSYTHLTLPTNREV